MKDERCIGWRGRKEVVRSMGPTGINADRQAKDDLFVSTAFVITPSLSAQRTADRCMRNYVGNACPGMQAVTHKCTWTARHSNGWAGVS